MSKQKIKKLAIIASYEETIPQDIQEFVLTQFSKKELKMFMSFYKAAIERKSVYVSTPSDLSADTLKMLREVFKNKEVITVLDKTLGAGIKVRQNDMIIDFTIKSFINDTINKLKN